MTVTTRLHGGGAVEPARAVLSSTHLPALDGVRGIAIILVMLYHFASSLQVLGVHLPGLRMFQIGWCGVDMFFALSGFLITGILLDTRSAPGYFRSFYAKRVLRIMPLYYGSLLVVFILASISPGAGIWGEQGSLLAGGSLVWPALFLQNVAILLHGSAHTGVTTHYWSLAVEEHFYLVWPLVVWAATRRQVLMLAALAAAVSIVGRAWVVAAGHGIDPVFALTPLRMDGLALGALAAVLLREAEGRTLRRAAWVVLAGSAVALAALLAVRHSVSSDDPALWVLSYPLVASGTAALIVVCTGGGPIAAAMSARPLRWFGRYSYGLYVWHPIVGMVLFHSALSPLRAGAPPAVVVLAAVLVFGLDLVVAWASYHLVEARFLALKRHFVPQPARAPASRATPVQPWDAPTVVRP